jgi:hypothetical protein
MAAIVAGGALSHSLPMNLDVTTAMAAIAVECAPPGAIRRPH